MEIGPPDSFINNDLNANRKYLNIVIAKLQFVGVVGVIHAVL